MRRPFAPYFLVSFLLLFTASNLFTVSDTDSLNTTMELMQLRKAMSQESQDAIDKIRTELDFLDAETGDRLFQNLLILAFNRDDM